MEATWESRYQEFILLNQILVKPFLLFLFVYHVIFLFKEHVWHQYLNTQEKKSAINN
jgi:hypothetical protein